MAERGAAFNEREATLVQRERQAQDALAQAAALAQVQRETAEREAAERGQADHQLSVEEARREIAALLAGVAGRERVVAEREAHLEHTLAQKGEALDLEARAEWLTDAVKTAARQEAETVIKEAREQAQRILANAREGRSTPLLADQPD